MILFVLNVEITHGLAWFIINHSMVDYSNILKHTISIDLDLLTTNDFNDNTSIVNISM